MVHCVMYAQNRLKRNIRIGIVFSVYEDKEANHLDWHNNITIISQHELFAIVNNKIV